MKPIFRSLIFGMISLIAPLAHTQEADIADLIRAAETGNLPRIRTLLSELDPNARDATGRTALMAAAKAGQFYAMRTLLWNGARAGHKDNSGTKARDLLSLEASGFAPQNLLLRCFEHVEDHRPHSGKAAHRDLVLVWDTAIEAGHDHLKSNFAVNVAEESGIDGVDDDRNGFTDDVFGWNPSLGRPSNPKPAPDESHGTHVAGIVLQDSDMRCRILSLEKGRTPFLTNEAYQGLAKSSESYADFVTSVRKMSLERAFEEGLTVSRYIRASGASVVNMSIRMDLQDFRKMALSLQKDFAALNPSKASTINGYACPIGLDLCGDLALELMTASSSLYAIVFRQNPDVLFVLAAGNDGERDEQGNLARSAANVDVTMDSPAYLSRFFPNVVSVASIEEETGQLSWFSSYGSRSVQFAMDGSDVRSSIPGNQWGDASGTSMATPRVSAVASLIRQNHPLWSPDEVRLAMETSVVRSDQLAGIVSTGGVLEKDRALRRAAAIASQQDPMMITEGDAYVDVALPRREMGPDGPDPGKRRFAAFAYTPPPPPPPTKPAPPPPVKPAPPAVKRSNWIVTHIGGFSGSWAVVMSRVSSPPAQRISGIFTSSSWPKAWVDECNRLGFGLSLVAGDSDGWILVADNRPASKGARVVGYGIDQTKINANWNEGYRITSFSGYKNNWLFLMHPRSAWGRQRFSMPSAWGSNRNKWLNDRFTEGHRFTGLGGFGDAEDGDAQYWMIVLSQNTGMGHQYYGSPRAWDEPYFRKRVAEGYALTSLTGYGNRWAHIYTKGTEYLDQRVRFSSTFPVEWIKEVWSE